MMRSLAYKFEFCNLHTFAIRDHVPAKSQIVQTRLKSNTLKLIPEQL